MKFVKRTEAPSTTNKYYLKYGKGGYNRAMEMNKNTHSCLSNCVAMAHGRWLECRNSTDVAKDDKLCAGNAENYYDYTKDGYKRGTTPKVGAIICWRKGKAGVASDGAGHVAFVEEVKANGDVITSNSAYNGKRYYLKTYKKSNNYYMGSAYTFQGFIYNPIEFDNKEKYKGDLPKLPLRGYFKYTYNSKKKKYTQMDKGKQVGNLQKFLNWAVDAKLEVDEKYGVDTGKAVNKFEKLVGLEIDHEFGKKCLAKAKTFEK